jgi:hypothetical protein
MVTTRAASKRQSEALEAAPLLLAKQNQPKPQKSKTERMQQQQTQTQQQSNVNAPRYVPFVPAAASKPKIVPCLHSTTSTTSSSFVCSQSDKT